MVRWRARLGAWSVGCSDSISGDTLAVIPFESMSFFRTPPCLRTPAAEPNYGRGGDEEQEAAPINAA